MKSFQKTRVILFALAIVFNYVASATPISGKVADAGTGELIIVIEDTGLGLEAERLSSAFSRYDRNPRLEKSSTGLDIPIIQALARMMGGDVEAQSEKDKGTTARVTLPCEATLVEKKKREE